MSSTYIYTMHRVNLFRGPEKQVLRDIWLSFYPGAKIGVLGGNGAGKSTLLRIMAGVDKASTATPSPRRARRVGYLPQEPPLDPSQGRARQRRGRRRRASARCSTGSTRSTPGSASR